MKKIGIIISTIIIISLMILLFWYNGVIIFNYPLKSIYEIRGVDISAHQGDIDWNVLANQGIMFAYIKATEGRSFVDEKFTINYENANKTNLKIGAYHFFKPDSTGEEQADNFIKTVPKLDGTLPPVVDIEFYEDNVEETQKQLQNMLNRLEEYYGKKPIIYATYESYDLFIANHFNEYYIWIRDVYFKPRLKDNREWTFWQYSNKIRLKGYKGKEKRIDMNVFNGDINKFEKLYQS